MTDRMDAVDHTHPTQDGVAEAYRRGRGADGLIADGSGDDADAADPMREVSHTPPVGEDTNDIWARGDDELERDDE
jgi:hypothetical protein